MPVDFEHRSGMDRREVQRPAIDLKLGQDINITKDIFAPFLNSPLVQQTQSANKNNTAFRKTIMAALSPIVPVRRISSLPDNIEDGNYLRAAGLLGFMAINLPEDGRDLKDALNQIKGIYEAPYNQKECQHTFSFFKGTLLERFLKIPGEKGERLANVLHHWDKTLFTTKFGKILTKLFKIDIDGLPLDYGKTYGRDIPIFAYKFKGNIMQKTIGRALLRIPLLSVIVLSVLELPAILKAFKSNHNSEQKSNKGIKQIIKSLVFIVSTFTGIGITGALLARKGPTGSLIGMGIGASAGAVVSNVINKKVDKSI